MPTLTVHERIEAIQRRLGLRPDGIIGPVTLTRIEDTLDRCVGAPETPAEPDHNLTVSKKGLDLIVAHEIGSEALYRRRFKNPLWPGGQSGVTIGIGYDLGFNSARQIEKDWSGHVADADLAALLTVAGLKGQKAKQAVSRVKHVEIPLDVAKRVYFTSTLPRYALLTRKAYPGVEKLPADAQAALLSLVYNRGARKSGSSRREMKAIEGLVRSKDLRGIAGEIRKMKRLWANKGLPGLLRRRDEEAELVEHADRQYQPDELVEV
ncbi:MAG: hypothetical protein R3362_01870 [Rhodothermales bacterium]|nr:hypothetical protein [Rhodothermales bacterium]